MLPTQGRGDVLWYWALPLAWLGLGGVLGQVAPIGLLLGSLFLLWLAACPRIPAGLCLLYHAPERTIGVPLSPERGNKRAGGHNSLTRVRLNTRCGRSGPRSRTPAQRFSGRRRSCACAAAIALSCWQRRTDRGRLRAGPRQCSRVLHRR